MTFPNIFCKGSESVNGCIDTYSPTLVHHLKMIYSLNSSLLDWTHSVTRILYVTPRDSSCSFSLMGGKYRMAEEFYVRITCSVPLWYDSSFRLPI